jgi:hypothetical protein
MIAETAVGERQQIQEINVFSNAADTNFSTFFDWKRVQESHGDENPAPNGEQESEIYTARIG